MAPACGFTLEVQQTRPLFGVRASASASPSEGLRMRSRSQCASPTLDRSEASINTSPRTLPPSVGRISPDLSDRSAGAQSHLCSPRVHHAPQPMRASPSLITEPLRSADQAWENYHSDKDETFRFRVSLCASKRSSPRRTRGPPRSKPPLAGAATPTTDPLPRAKGHTRPLQTLDRHGQIEWMREELAEIDRCRGPPPPPVSVEHADRASSGVSPNPVPRSLSPSTMTTPREIGGGRARLSFREDFDLDRELLVAQCAPSSPPLATCHTLVIALGQAVCYRQLPLATWHAMVTPLAVPYALVTSPPLGNTWQSPSSPHLPLVTRV